MGRTQDRDASHGGSQHFLLGIWFHVAEAFHTFFRALGLGLFPPYLFEVRQNARKSR